MIGHRMRQAAEIVATNPGIGQTELAWRMSGSGYIGKPLFTRKGQDFDGEYYNYIVRDKIIKKPTADAPRAS